MIFAIDFDGTLCNEIFPEIGDPDIEMITAVKRLKEIGHTIILWTTREDVYRVENEKMVHYHFLSDALQWCHGYGLQFDAVNQNHTIDYKGFKGPRRKVTADYYIDDRAHGYRRDFVLTLLERIATGQCLFEPRLYPERNGFICPKCGDHLIGGVPHR